MSSDDGLRVKLREGLRRYDVHFQSVETATTGGGVPDANVCRGGVETWIECKATGTYKFNHYQPEQVGWHLARVRAGGRVVVATRRRHEGGPRKGAGVDELWLHSGRHADKLRAGGLLDVEPLLLTPGGPSRWDWDAVAQVLFSAVL